MNRHLCNRILLELRDIKQNYNRISIDLSDIKQLLAPCPSETDELINSIQHSAQEIREQSILHRKYVEQSINSSNLKILRKEGR